jgi:hypothetical protein
VRRGPVPLLTTRSPPSHALGSRRVVPALEQARNDSRETILACPCDGVAASSGRTLLSLAPAEAGVGACCPGVPHFTCKWSSGQVVVIVVVMAQIRCVATHPTLSVAVAAHADITHTLAKAHSGACGADGRDLG